MLQLLGLDLQMLQMQPAARRLSSSSDEGAEISETSKGMPFKSRMISRANVLGRAALMSGELKIGCLEKLLRTQTPNRGACKSPVPKLGRLE